MLTKEDSLMLAAVEESLAGKRDFSEEIKKVKDELMCKIAEVQKVFHIRLEHSRFIDEFGKKPTKCEYERKVISYLAKLRDIFEKNNCEFVFLEGVKHEERKSGKAHHHLLILYQPEIRIEEIERLWKHGRVSVKVVDTSPLRGHVFG